MAAKIRRNDEVIILAGKDKGKKGKVLSNFMHAISQLSNPLWIDTR